MDDSAPAYPTEEYIAGRERGRTAGLKRSLKIRLLRIALFVSFGGSLVGLTFSSTSVTGYSHGSARIFFSILSVFVVLGCLGCIAVVRSYRRSLNHLRDDIVRSVMTPDEATPQPGRFRKWWIKGEASSAPAWDQPPRDAWNKTPDKTSEPS